MAAEAVDRLAAHHGFKLQQVDKIALEGAGKIEERIDMLWKALLNHLDLIREADLIFLACHSQGVPVGVSLIANLINFGCCKSSMQIAICAMAGVNLGPFGELKSRWLGTTASGELFDYARQESDVSRNFHAALETVLGFGSKITLVGSLDDQLVPLYSSTFATLKHPHVYRAVWVDGRLHVANFLTHLVAFALKVQNLGVSDHGLIRELSRPLAGNLVGGEGHSVCLHPKQFGLLKPQSSGLNVILLTGIWQRVYEDSRVYE